MCVYLPLMGKDPHVIASRQPMKLATSEAGAWRIIVERRRSVAMRQGLSRLPYVCHRLDLRDGWTDFLDILPDIAT